MKTYITKPIAKNMLFAHQEVGFEVVDTDICCFIKLNNEVEPRERTKKFAIICNHFLKRAGFDGKMIKMRFFKED